jgi:predicted site-specific integrase-resolvase
VSEACNAAGISRPTFLRWAREGDFADVRRRDWRGWRLFSDEEFERLKAKVNRIQDMDA